MRRSLLTAFVSSSIDRNKRVPRASDSHPFADLLPGFDNVGRLAVV